MENTMKANPKDIAEQRESQLRDFKEACGEAILPREKNHFNQLTLMLKSIDP